MEEMKFFYELFESMPRCGPGADEFTRQAFKLMSHLPEKPYILDIGCGPGVQTIELAKISNGKVVALDNHQAFLDKLMETAREEGLEDNIIPRNMSMLEMDFDEKTFDIIWSEGALYFMGFQNGLRRCRELLKDDGYAAVTEAVYLISDPPAPVTQFFKKEYPDIKDVKSNIGLIQEERFHLISNFTMPESAWLDSYYLPMEDQISRLSRKYRGNETALSVLGGCSNEIDFYKKYSAFYGYEFFVMQKVDR
ncbi:MAG TPA: class I SAM-dependent methyltransferase [Spirochaetota bacterium]|nr:class I SAM-dependent methyltransferase [Spirochaetota bacterium]